MNLSEEQLEWLERIKSRCSYFEIKMFIHKPNIYEGTPHNHLPVLGQAGSPESVSQSSGGSVNSGS